MPLLIDNELIIAAPCTRQDCPGTVFSRNTGNGKWVPAKCTHWEKYHAS
jgi:hypothetical protein